MAVLLNLLVKWRRCNTVGRIILEARPSPSLSPSLSLVRALQPEPSVQVWNNAFDSRDIVALNPLDRANFPVQPEIRNYGDIKNHTNNRHGIDGYLDDPIVAGWVLDALN
jgi:hypothetical protein